MLLTPAIKIAYAYPIAALPVIGFDSSFGYNIGVQAPSNPSVLFAFIAPEGFLYGGMRGEAFGLAGLADGVHRSVNPAYAVTNLFDSEWCRFGLNQILDIIMSTLFVLREGISEKECREQIHVLNEQMLVLIENLSTYTETRESIALPENFNKFGWLLWLLGTLLEQQNKLCERVTGGRV